MAKNKKEEVKISTNKLSDLKSQFNKQFGSNVLQTFDEDDDDTIERISSGILSLDLILGRGSNGYGWPKGRVSEIFGPESGGKSSIVLNTVAEVTKNGGIAAIIDAENALNLEYAKKLGVNLDNLLISNPDSAEEGYNLIEALAKSGDVKLIVLDSIVAMVPSVIMEADFEDKFMDTGAKLNNQFLRVICSTLNKYGCTLLIVNQIREKVGISYGSNEYTPGGRGLKFYASSRVEVRRSELLKDDMGEDYAHIIKVKTVKNRTACPQRIAEIKLVWGKGFESSYCVLNQAVKKDVVKKSGAWYYFGEEKFQGKDAIIERLNNDNEFSSLVQSKVMEAL